MDVNDLNRLGPVKFYQRGKKRIFVADFWHEGKHCRRSLKTSNVKVARDRAIKLANDICAGELKSITKPAALAVAVEDFQQFLDTEGRRPKTQGKYKGLMKIFVKCCNARDVKLLDRVTPAIIDQFRAMRKSTCSAKTMHNEGIMLKAFFRWAKRSKLLRESPMEEMTFKKPRSNPRGGPTLAQVQDILAKARGQRRCQIALLAFGGMRSGDAQRLLVRDVDLQGDWLHIMSRTGAETKTGESRKTPIHPVLKLLLTEAVPARRSRDGWFFCEVASRKYPNGDHQMNTKRLNEDFLRILKQLGISAGKKNGGFTIHSLRSFFKTFCINSGVPKEVVDIWQGHAPDRSASAGYYRLSDEESQRFMKAVPFKTNEPGPGAGK